MSDKSGRRVFNGAFGKLFINGIEFANVSKVETKIDLNRSDVQFAGDLGVDSKIESATGSGSMTLHKTNSRVAVQVLPIIKSGRDVRFDLLLTVDDPDAIGKETIAVPNCWFDSIDLVSFEVGKKTEENVSFGFNPSSADLTDKAI